MAYPPRMQTLPYLTRKYTAESENTVSNLKHFTLTAPLSTQVYKWVQANLMLGVTLRWTSIPSQGSRNMV